MGSHALSRREVDVVMLGTFSAWRLGTLQARALPLAQALLQRGIRCAIVTTPWDDPSERGVHESHSGVPLINTRIASPTLFPIAVYEQYRAIERLNPALVHVFKPRGFGGMTATLVRDRPVLIDSDDWEGDGGWNRHGNYSLTQRRLFDWQERTLLRRADGVTAASTLLLHRARQIRHDRCDSVYHVPNGLPRSWLDQLLAAGRQRAPLAASAEPCIVIYSRFAEFPRDWFPRFAAALDARLTQRVRLIVVGESGGDSLVMGQSGLKIELMGYVARNSIPSTLANAHIAVFPYDDTLLSRSKNSVKLLELMANGCTVVASDVGDVATTVSDTAVLVNGSDPVEFARVVAQLIGDPARCDALGASAAHRAESTWGVDAIAGTLGAIYQRYFIP